GGSRYLRSVTAEDAIPEKHRLLHLSEMFNRHTGAARARVVAVDLDVFDRRIRPRVNLDSATVGIEEGCFPDVVRFDRRFLSRPGGEGPGARDLEAAQNGLSRHPIAEIDDVVDDGRIAREVGIRD